MEGRNPHQGWLKMNEIEYDHEFAVEEDGDEIFVPLSAGCLRWECQTWEPGADRPTHPKLVAEDGFWKCPTCHASYGPVDP